MDDDESAAHALEPQEVSMIPFSLAIKQRCRKASRDPAVRPGLGRVRADAIRLEAFRALAGALVGAGMLLAAASGPGAAAPRQSELPPESVAPVDCPVSDCFVVPAEATYCSLDPYRLVEGRLFASKARLSLPTGVYPLDTPRALAEFEVTLETPAATRSLSPTSARIYSLERGMDEPGDGLDPLRWIEIQAPFAGDGISLEELFVRTSRWPQEHYHMGDPHSARWFFEASRNLFVKVREGGKLFPPLAETRILFAPCGFSDVPDQRFRFRFANGDRLDLRVRALVGVDQIGYYVGRLIAASGTLDGEPVNVRDRVNLAFFGSTRAQGQLTIPSLAVRAPRKGDSCGVILDTRDWDSRDAVNGYIAYTMTCDERRGPVRPLVDVSYPETFALP